MSETGENMKSFFGTDRLKRSRILKAILFIIIMISAVSSMSLLYKSVYAQEENQHKYAAKKRVLFISSYSYAWETVPEQIAGCLLYTSPSPRDRG